MVNSSLLILPFSALRHSLLIAGTVAYLLGQVCASWHWFVFTPLWLGAFMLLVSIVWYGLGRGLAAIVGCVLLTFSLANVALQRVIVPQLPSEHLRHLSLPQEILVEGWLFREP